MSLAPPFSVPRRRRFAAALIFAVIALNIVAVVLSGLAQRQAAPAAADAYTQQLQQIDAVATLGRDGSLMQLFAGYSRLALQLEHDKTPNPEQVLAAYLQAQATTPIVLRGIALGALLLLIGLACLGCMSYGIYRLVTGPPLRRRWNLWQQGVVSPLPVWTLLAGIVLTFAALIFVHALPAARNLFVGLAAWEAAQALLLTGLLLVARRQTDLQPGLDFGFRRRPLAAIRTGLKYYFAWLPVIVLSRLLGLFSYSLVDAAAGHPPEPPGGAINDLLAPTNGLWGPLVLMVIAVGLAPLFEELFFRGFLYGALRRWLAAPIAVVLCGLCFAAVHPMPDHLPIFLLGMLLAFTYEKTGNLAASMVVHFTHNFLTLLLMGLTLL